MNYRKAEKKKSILPEVLITGALFAVMAIIRVIYINSHEINDAGFYELCRIRIGTEMPQLEYGIGDLYVKLLYCLFWLFGNHITYGVYLQFVLQMGAMMLFYAAMRRLLDFVPAIAITTALFVFPQFMESLVTLNQQNLLLFILGMNLAGAAVLLGGTIHTGQKKYHTVIALLLVGMLGGISVYLEKLYLAIPAVIVLVLLIAKRPKQAVLVQKRVLQLPLYLIGLCIGFGVVVLVKQQFAGQQYMEVFAEYDRVQLNGGLFYSDNVMNYALAILLYTIFAVVCAGLVTNSYRGKAVDGLEQKAELQIKDIESFEPAETESLRTESEQDAVSAQKEKIKYLDNPLPLPKRHVKKEMNYGFEPDENLMKYDIAVADDDDFDVP